MKWVLQTAEPRAIEVRMHQPARAVPCVRWQRLSSSRAPQQPAHLQVKNGDGAETATQGRERYHPQVVLKRDAGDYVDHERPVRVTVLQVVIGL